MATPAWLPPLNSHHQHHITVQISQNRGAEFMGSVNRPMFMMNFWAFVDFISDNKDTMEKSFRGLSIWETIPVPCDYVTSDSEILSESFIGVMLYSLCLFEFDGAINWAERHLGDEVVSCCELFEDTDVLYKIREFLHGMREKEFNSGKNVLRFDLIIRKKVIIPDEELKSWNCWYSEKKRSDPHFESEFRRAISRPRTEEELMEEIHFASRGRTLRSPIQDLEVVEVDESSSERFCSICLEEFSLLSQVIKLPCCHVFDENCIGKWLRENQTCPLCRFLFQNN